MLLLPTAALIVAVGIVPMVVYALILWWFDRYEKEPLPLLTAAFLWGALPAILFSVIVELVLDVPISYFVQPAVAGLIGAAVVAPVVEETVKAGALVLLILFFRHELDSPLDGIIYGGLVGFGFAAVENIFYFIDVLDSSGLGGLVQLVILRAFVFGLNHAMFTGVTGLGVALMRTSPHMQLKLVAPVIGLAGGIAAHAIHNGSVVLGAELCWPCVIALITDWGGVLLLLGVIAFTTTQEHRWLVTFLADEVESGTLSKEDYRTVCSYTERLASRARALLRGDIARWRKLGRYYHLLTELAFTKRRLSRFPGESETQARISRLRQQVKRVWV
ncbi:MAG: PrsW family intramembrane metalloprotease [Anaerolineae bacterium]|nr:PrsW family intramembrane metalloprotease [Anaerolineae bacterium]